MLPRRRIKQRSSGGTSSASGVVRSSPKQQQQQQQFSPPITTSTTATTIDSSSIIRSNNNNIDLNSQIIKPDVTTSTTVDNDKEQQQQQQYNDDDQQKVKTTSKNNKGYDKLLYLALGLDPTNRIISGTMDYFTIQDFRNVQVVSRTIRNQLQYIDYTNCYDGKDYMVPYPGFPGLLGKNNINNKDGGGRISSSSGGLFTHQLASLRAMYQLENQNTEFGALRGGILGDAPGLGKTITMLALIVSTAGTNVRTPPEFWDATSIRDGWYILRTNPAMSENINRSLKPIRLWVNTYWNKRSTPQYREYKRILQYVQPPYRDNRLLSIDEYERYVRTKMKDIGIPVQILDAFRSLLLDIRINLDKNHRKVLQNRDMNSSNDLHRLLFERRLVGTSATLIIVPDPLLEHWTQQIYSHLNLAYLSTYDRKYNYSDLSGIVYIDGLGDIVNWMNESDHSISLQTAFVYNAAAATTNTKSTSRGAATTTASTSNPLPSVWDLVQYTIIITTFSRCEQEYLNEVRYGRIAVPKDNNNNNANNNNPKNKGSSNNNNDDDDDTTNHRGRKRRHSDISSSPTPNNNSYQQTGGSSSSAAMESMSTLLRMRWLRLVVDEGHELGRDVTTRRSVNNGTTSTNIEKSDKDEDDEAHNRSINNITQFINQIAAERRWVISGTPTTGDEDQITFHSNALDQIQRLFYFLRHPKYGRIPTKPLVTSLTSLLVSKSSSKSNSAQIVVSSQNKQQYDDLDDDDDDEDLTTGILLSGRGNRNNSSTNGERIIIRGDTKTKWETTVKIPFLNHKESGRQELIRVLQETMVMHRKEDIQLPSPQFSEIEQYTPIPDEKEKELIALYNKPALVDRPDAVNQHMNHSTQLIKSFEAYIHSPEQQSLVDMEQAKCIIEAVQEERRKQEQRVHDVKKLQFASSVTKTADNVDSSFVGNPNSMNIYHDSKKNKYNPQYDTRPIKAVVYSHEINNLLSVADQILRRMNPEYIAELYGNKDIADLSSELNRFRTGIKEYRTCPICKRENSSTGTSTRGRNRNICQNMLLEVVLRSDDTQRYLIEPERIRYTLNVQQDRMDGESLDNYKVHSKFWAVDDLLMVDLRDPHPILPQRPSEDQWYEWGLLKCEELAELDDYEGTDWYYGPLPDQNETDDDDDSSVIRNIDRRYQGLVAVILKKWQRCGNFHNPRKWFRGPTLAEQPVERVKQDVHLLLLDAKLSHGLDLSFVTNMYLLEAIEDAALLEQVTSRAHRIGATGPVKVATVNIFYKTSVELDVALQEAMNDMVPDDTTVAATTTIRQHAQKAFTKQVCDHCYRSFDTMAEAIFHEVNHCQRNPKNVSKMDPYSLTSIYRSIRPPSLLEQTNEVCLPTKHDYSEGL